MPHQNDHFWSGMNIAFYHFSLFRCRMFSTFCLFFFTKAFQAIFDAWNCSYTAASVLRVDPPSLALRMNLTRPCIVPRRHHLFKNIFKAASSFFSVENPHIFIYFFWNFIRIINNLCIILLTASLVVFKSQLIYLKWTCNNIKKRRNNRSHLEIKNEQESGEESAGCSFPNDCVGSWGVGFQFG